MFGRISAPSSLQPVCPYCEILGHGKVEFSSEDLLERHGVQKHPGWPIHSKIDIEKFRQEYSRKKEKRDEGLSGYTSSTLTKYPLDVL